MNQIFLGLLDGLADGHGNFARLAHAETGVAALIADDHQRGKAQVLAALDDLGDALDGHDLILQIVGADLDGPADRQCFPQNMFRHRVKTSIPPLGPLRPGLPRGRGTCSRRDRTRPAGFRPRGRARQSSLPTIFGRGHIAAALESACASPYRANWPRPACGRWIVDHLRVDMTERAIDAQARTLGRAHDALAHARVHRAGDARCAKACEPIS